MKIFYFSLKLCPLFLTVVGRLGLQHLFIPFFSNSLLPALAGFWQERYPRFSFEEEFKGPLVETRSQLGGHCNDSGEG